MNNRSNIYSGPEGSKANIDEARVAEYELPDILTSCTGVEITSFNEWLEVKRPEILSSYEQYIFGTSPVSASVSYVTLESEQENKKNGIRLQLYNMYLGDVKHPITQFVVFTPATLTFPVPAFLGPNFLGNQSITDCFTLPLATSWVYPRPSLGIDSTGHATASSIGAHRSRWPLTEIIRRGYGVISFHYADLFPDRADGKQNSIQKPVEDRTGNIFSWGALSTWAWGMRKVLDCVASISRIDENKIIAVGHSRLGKAALWAAGQDPRFAAVIANESGEGGAAISRRKFGERVSDIVERFPHWFTRDYKMFADKEESMPVDSHELISLMAPRPVYIASAQDDLWSDPRGEFMGMAEAAKVWRLSDAEIKFPQTMPEVHQPVSGRLGYHIRRGGHDITQYDWIQFLNFSDKYIK